MAQRDLGLGGYVLKRVLQAIPLLLGVVVISFAIIHLAPGDPIQALVGDFPAPEEYVRKVREEFGLDRPLIEQYVRYVGNLARGEFGYSFVQRRPVLTREVERLAHEHYETQQILDRIHQEIDQLKPDDHLLIRDCCARIQDVIGYIEHHENAENLLVFTAFTDDLGTTD